MKPAQIEVGKTYRFCGDGGKELKPRTVVSYDTEHPWPFGKVVAHTGVTSSGRPSQAEYMSGDYFARHVLEK